jgi:hypothetical protein
VPLSDRKLLDTIMPGVATVPASALNYEWSEAWIRDMKRVHHLAPSTLTQVVLQQRTHPP